MRKGTITQLLSLAFMSIALLTGFNTSAQNSAAFSKPGYSENYTHDGTNWVHQSNSTFTYNAQGKPLEELQQNPATNQNTLLKVYTYDANGNPTRSYTHRWRNSAWEFYYGFRDTITYTPTNKIATYLSTMYGPSGWNNNLRVDYTYDAKNNELEQTTSLWDLTLGLWQPSSKHIYAYDAAGNIIHRQYLHHTNGAWTILFTESNITWHIPNEIPATYDLDDPKLNYPQRATITMGANGGTIKLIESYFAPSSQWRNATKETINYDTNGNLTRRYYESFNNNGMWGITADYQENLTYNNLADVTERVIRAANYNISAPGNGSPPYLNKYIYSNFQYFPRQLGISKEDPASLQATIFPNPTQGMITIKSPTNKALKLTATISDLSGKKLFYKSFNKEEVRQIDLKSLPKGIYLIHLETEKGKTVQKIVKN